MVRLAAILPLALSATIYASTTIMVPVSTYVGQAPKGARLIVTLQGCQSPRIVGSAFLPLYPVPLDASTGSVTTTIYDNSQILCTQGDGTLAKSSFYSFSVLYQGATTQLGAYQFSSGTYNLSTLTPCLNGACVLSTPPTGDSTYLRLDGANAGSFALIQSKPVSSQTVYQPIGTTLATTSLNNVMYAYASQGVDIFAAANALLATCGGYESGKSLCEVHIPAQTGYADYTGVTTALDARVGSGTNAVIKFDGGACVQGSWPGVYAININHASVPYAHLVLDHPCIKGDGTANSGGGVIIGTQGDVKLQNVSISGFAGGIGLLEQGTDTSTVDGGEIINNQIGVELVAGGDTGAAPNANTLINLHLSGNSQLNFYGASVGYGNVAQNVTMEASPSTAQAGCFLSNGPMTFMGGYCEFGSNVYGGIISGGGPSVVGMRFQGQGLADISVAAGTVSPLISSNRSGSTNPFVDFQSASNISIISPVLSYNMLSQGVLVNKNASLPFADVYNFAGGLGQGPMGNGVGVGGFTGSIAAGGPNAPQGTLVQQLGILGQKATSGLAPVCITTTGALQKCTQSTATGN